MEKTIYSIPWAVSFPLTVLSIPGPGIPVLSIPAQICPGGVEVTQRIFRLLRKMQGHNGVPVADSAVEVADTAGHNPGAQGPQQPVMLG